MSDEHIWRECRSDNCLQGKRDCPTPQACEVSGPSDRAWLLNDLSVIGIAALCLVGWVAGWFA